MKKFDFDHPDFKKSCLPKQRFLQFNHEQAITEDEFVKAVQDMPKHEHWSWGHSPSAARSRYRRLVKDYGFFPGGQS